MAGIRALIQEVADLYAALIQLHREMLGCHQAQKNIAEQSEQALTRLDIYQQRQEELIIKMDEREQKLIAVEDRVLRNMTALADLIGDPHDATDESPGKDPAYAEERLRRNIDALP